MSKIIVQNSICYSVQNVYPNKIDELNILNATILAMHKCIKNLTVKPEFLIIDGNKFKKYSNIPHKTIVRGDAKYSRSLIASALFGAYLAIPPALIFTCAGFGVRTDVLCA